MNTTTPQSKNVLANIRETLIVAAATVMTDMQSAMADLNRAELANLSKDLDTITALQIVASNGTPAKTDQPQAKVTRAPRGSKKATKAPGRPKRAYNRKPKGAAIPEAMRPLVASINEVVEEPKFNSKPRKGRGPGRKNKVAVDGAKRSGNRAFKAPEGTTTSVKEFRPHLLAAFEKTGATTFLEAQTAMFETMSKDKMLKDNDTRTTSGTNIPRWRACTGSMRKVLITQGVIRNSGSKTVGDKTLEVYELTSEGKKELASWKTNSKKELAHAS